MNTEVESKEEETEVNPCPKCEGTVNPETVTCNDCGLNIPEALEEMLSDLFGRIEESGQDSVLQHAREYNTLCRKYRDTLGKGDAPIEMGLQFMVPKHQLLIALQLQEIDKTLMAVAKVVAPILNEANKHAEERNNLLSEIVAALKDK